jgi:predicted aconitase
MTRQRPARKLRASLSYRPVFPATAKVVKTNSGKYAHYGPGLSGCAVRLGKMDWLI